MKVKVIGFFIIGLCFGIVTKALALPIPSPPQFEASSYILIDAGSGAVLAELNPYERVDPASITKIMTAYVVYKALAEGDISMEDEVLISEKAWRSIGSRMFVEVGDKILLSDLLLGLIIQSGNDASVALAEHVAGSESAFADIMNAEAVRLEMYDTHYVNATGLPDPEHYTTARDVATLSRSLIQKYPEQYKLYAQKEYTFNDIKQFNRNRLLWRDTAVDGIKTGHTEAAGYCLAASAFRNNMRLITVVMGTSSDKSRTVNSQALLNYGFRYYESHKFHKAGDTLVANHRMWGGESKTIPLGLSEDLHIVIPRGKSDALKANIQIESDITAPIAQGDEVGSVVVSLDGEEYARTPLVAVESNPKGSIFRRVVDFILKFFY